ncbi:MAG: aerobic C4-dicarboxylate transport protein, partial [Mycobacterium sp.]|nr:aerobic C4-dicarboxylate transport protein [Mycobacterium sp.]
MALTHGGAYVLRMTDHQVVTSAEEQGPRRSRWYTSLFAQLLIAIVAGILVGWLWPAFGADLKPLADGFIKLIK